MDDSAFSTSTIDPNTQTILLYASNHDIPSLKPLLRIPGNASVQDPETGYTPLHAAIAACGEYDPSKLADGKEDNVEEDGEEKVDIEKAKATVKELFLSGAIWNDLDANDETPGCLAWRLGWRDLYELCVEAGIRAEVLLGLMGGYEELDSEDEDEEMEEEVADGEKIDTETTDNNDKEKNDTPDEAQPKRDVNSKDYLASTLTLNNGNLLDSDNNGVMMTWETSIMQESVSRLLPPSSNPTPKKILNIGFGLGIIDGMFAATNPHTHHIIEAHPDVLSSLSLPDAKFGKEWEASAPADGGSYKVFPGKWQAVVPELLEAGQKYDAIYFDTFGESYGQLRFFFQEYVPELLVREDKEKGIEGGRFGFFNGLGADRRVCYDVYYNMVEIDLQEIGMEAEWFDVPVSEEVCGKREGEGEWEGVRRRYWVLDTYRLPILRIIEAAE